MGYVTVITGFIAVTHKETPEPHQGAQKARFIVSDNFTVTHVPGITNLKYNFAPQLKTYTLKSDQVVF